MLCISTSEWVLRTPFTSLNQFFDAKTTFCVLLSHKMYKITQKITKNLGCKGVYQHWGVTLKRWLTPKSWSTPEQNAWFWAAFLQFFVHFVLLVTEKVILASESLFWPANGMWSTRLLFEIHNTQIQFSAHVLMKRFITGANFLEKLYIKGWVYQLVKVIYLFLPFQTSTTGQRRKLPATFNKVPICFD